MLSAPFHFSLFSLLFSLFPFHFSYLAIAPKYACRRKGRKQSLLRWGFLFVGLCPTPYEKLSFSTSYLSHNYALCIIKQALPKIGAYACCRLPSSIRTIPSVAELHRFGKTFPLSSQTVTAGGELHPAPKYLFYCSPFLTGSAQGRTRPRENGTSCF